MKKINSRDFQKRFGKISDGLRAGETVEITKHGKVVGRFIKERKKTQWPDIMAYLEKNSCPPEVGDELVRKFFDESLS